MSQKFNKVTTTSNFIKNLLASTYLPLIKTVRDTDYIIKGRLYVYKCEVIMCTKSGYIITGFKNASDKRPRATFERRAEYFFGERNDKLCTNYVSNAAGYDFLTHERLGKYLRGLRDMYGLNLMPLYNCFSNQPLPRHHIYNDRIVSTGLNFNTKVFKVPIRFNTDYTICMENLGMTTFAPAFVKNNNLLSVDNTNFGNSTDLTNKYLRLHREGVVINRPNLRFKNPLVIRFNNIPETKTIKYYLQEDRVIDLNEDRWYKQVVSEEDEHLYIRTISEDGEIIYKYYDFIPSLSPSEGLYPREAEFSIDSEITEEIFNDNKAKYFYVRRAFGVLTYESEELRNTVYEKCEEVGLVLEYSMKKGEDAFLVKDASNSILINLEALEYKVPEEELEKAIVKISSASGSSVKSQECKKEYTSCKEMEIFDPNLTYYYVSKEGLYPMAGNQVSAYRGINPSIGTFDSDVSIYTAVNLRRQCNILMPFDAEANYYTIEGNFYVLVHPTKDEYDANPERFYLDNDFGGDPTNYFKLIPSTYLPPGDSLYPSNDLYPFDKNGKRQCRSGVPFDPSKNYYIYDEASDSYILVRITEDEYNANPEMYYVDNTHVLVSNTLGKFVRCSSEEKFNMNLTYAEMKKDSLSWREKKYIYNKVEISEAQFSVDKTKYYKLVDNIYVQCTEDDKYDEDINYYTQTVNLINTKDTWIHLDKEYYLQHPIIVENNYTYDITESNCSLYEEFENNLYLLIQVPEAFNSSIVILEGDYTNTRCKKIFNSSDIDIMPESLLDYFFTSNLKLMEAASTEVIPFSDTLMEFLTWNAINGLDSINNDMDRISILMKTVYPEPFKEAFRKNFWFPGYREAIYNMAKEHNIFHITDNLGYVTKDVEALLYTLYTISDPGEKPLNID